MSQVYNSPGKARKQCDCGVYIHARVLTCPSCGKNFDNKNRKTIDKLEPKTYNEPSKGRKLCKCGKYIGARCYICPECQNMDFSKPKQESPRNFFGMLIYTPAGKCPYNLLSDDREEVFNWCDNVFNYGLKNRYTYTANALNYWARTFNLNVKDLINEWDSEFGYGKNNSNIERHETSPEGPNSSLLILNSEE